MSKKMTRLLIAVLLVSAGLANAASFFTENFSGLAMPANMESNYASGASLDGTNHVSFTAGNAAWNAGANRQYIRTIQSDYSSISFRFEVTITVSGGPWGSAYIGMGQGGANTAAWGEPTNPLPCLMAMLQPTGFGSNLDGRDNGIGPFLVSGAVGDGTHRVRFDWDATTQVATISIDKNYGTPGSPFTVDAIASLDGSDNSFDATNSHLVFGGGENMIVDDIAVTAKPAAATGPLARYEFDAGRYWNTPGTVEEVALGLFDGQYVESGGGTIAVVDDAQRHHCLSITSVSDSNVAYISVPGISLVSETNYAVSFWFKTSSSDAGILELADGAGAFDRCVFLEGGNVKAYLWSGAEPGDTIATDGTNYADGSWHHVVHTFQDPAYGQVLYVDGVLKAGPGFVKSFFTAQSILRIGVSQFPITKRNFNGQIDDVRVYNQYLSLADVTKLRLEHPYAWNKSPGSDNGYVDEMGVALSWYAGDKAQATNGHGVYFGTSYAAVKDANTSDLTGIYKGRQTATTFDPGALEFDKTYYWRIDEFKDGDANSPWADYVYSFTTTEYFMLDGFQSYADTTAIHTVWTDGMSGPSGGNGTTAFAEIAVYPGDGDNNHRLSLSYNNSGGSVAEVSRAFAGGWQDWTAREAKGFEVYFTGAATNDAAQLYIRLKDINNHTAQISYANTTDVQEPAWHTFGVDLTALAAVNPPFDLTKVKEMVIGLSGNAAGVITLDWAQLRPVRCVTPLGPEDLNDDCVVDFADFAQFASHWLDRGLWP
jgi:hypothetical protein